MGIVATLGIRVTAIISDFEKQMAGLEKTLGRQGAKMQSLGRDLTKGLTLPIVALGGLSLKAASDFQSSFAGVRKTVDGVVDTGGNLTAFGVKLQQQFRDLAKELPISVNELNRIGESAGQLGIKSESVIGFTKTIAMMGSATNLSFDQAADGMARFANITQMPQDKIQNLGSVIVELGNKLAATESEILDFGLRIAGAGEIVGMTEANIMAIAGAFSSVGIEAEAGGTAVQKALLSMNSAVNAGKAGGFGAVAGMSGDEFAKSFTNDPGEAFTRFVEGVGKAGKGGEALLKNLGIDDARQIRAFLSMGAAQDLLRQSMKMAGDEWVRNTALLKEYEQRSKTFESQVTILKNKAYDLAITFGTSLLIALQNMMPAIERVMGAFTGLAQWFSQLPGPVQTAVFAIAGFAAALGPLAYLGGTLMSTGGALAGLLRTLAGAGTAAAGTSMLANALVLLKGGLIGGLIATGAYGIYQLVGAFHELYRTWNEGRSMWAFFSQKDDDNFVRRMLGLSKGTDALAASLKGGRRTTDIELAPMGGNDIAAQLAGDPEAAKRLRADMAHEQGGASTHKAAPEISQMEQSIRSLTATIDGSQLVEKANAWTAALERIGGIGHLTHDELTQFQTDITATVEKMHAMQQAVPPLWDAIATRKVLGDQLQQAMQQGSPQLYLQTIDNQQTRDLLANPANSPGVGATAPQPLAQGQTWAAQFVDGTKVTLTQLPQVIMNALQGGGSVGKSIGALFGGEITGGLAKHLTSGLSGMFGKTIGGALGSVIPGLGTMLGSMIGPMIGKLAGKIWGGIQSIFGHDEESRSVNPARDAFAAQFRSEFGGSNSDAVTKALEAAGLGGTRAAGLIAQFNAADTMTEFTAAKAAIEQALAGAKTNTDDLTQANETFNMSLTGSDEAIKQLGQTEMTVTQMMLEGFSHLIAKIDEMIGKLSMAGAMSASVTAASIGGVAMTAGNGAFSTPGDFIGTAPMASNSDLGISSGGPSVTINAGNIIGNPDELADMVVGAWEDGGDSASYYRDVHNQIVTE